MTGDSTAQQERSSEPGGNPELDRLFQQAVDAGDLPGVVAMVADRDGTTYAAAFGHCSAADNAALTADSVFWIASMSKAITSVAAMQLVEQGKLQLDSPLGDIVPDLAAPQVLEGFADDGRPRLRPARREITLRHLLTHTSGFGYAFGDTQLLQYVLQEQIPDITTCTTAAYRLPLLFEPGERWHYGIGIDWAGRVVEAVSGQSLEDYLKEHILAPLGMRDTGFALTSAQQERLVAMHARLPDGSLQQIPFALPQNPEFYMGGGGLYGTARDYLRFLRMILQQGQLDGVRILRPETVQLMTQNQIGDLQAGQIKSAVPELTNDCDFFPGMQQRWGLGFLINTEPSPQGRSAGSLAWAGLGNTYYWLDPAHDLVGLFMTQILPFADSRAIGVFNQFEAGVYRHLAN